MNILSNVLDSMPAVGHIKGLVHYACGDTEGGNKAMYQATRSTAVLGAAAAGSIAGPGGAVAAAMYAGIATDAAASVVMDKPQGIVRGCINVAEDIKDGRDPTLSIASTGFQVGMDGLGGFGMSGGVSSAASQVSGKAVAKTAENVAKKAVATVGEKAIEKTVKITGEEAVKMVTKTVTEKAVKKVIQTAASHADTILVSAHVAIQPKDKLEEVEHERDRERRAREREERRDREEAERRAREEAERRAREQTERRAREEAERRAREDAERRAREEAERHGREEAERRARDEAERRAREQTERRAREDAERRASEEAERRAREQTERRAREEAERRAREEAERRAREETERRAREQTERRAREEAERRAREEAERRAREEAERRAREQTERRAREEAERRATEQAERRTREEAERRAREEAERRAREQTERRASEQRQQARERSPTSGTNSGSSQPPRDNNNESKKAATLRIFAEFLEMLNRLLNQIFGDKNTSARTIILEIFANLSQGQKIYLVTIIERLRTAGILEEVVTFVIKIFSEHFPEHISFLNFLSLSEFVAAYTKEELSYRIVLYRMAEEIAMESDESIQEMKFKDLVTTIISDIMNSADILNTIVDIFLRLQFDIESETEDPDRVITPNFRDIFSAVYHYFKHRCVPDAEVPSPRESDEYVNGVLSVREYYDWIRTILGELRMQQRYAAILAELETSSNVNATVRFDVYVVLFGRRVRIVVKFQGTTFVLSSCFIVEIMHDGDKEGDVWIDIYRR